MSYVEDVLDNKWSAIEERIEKIAAVKIAEKIEKKKLQVIEKINKS